MNQLRVVDKHVIYGGAVPFRTVMEKVLTPQTRYLVIDLDRTFHLGRNVGELLGFELCAHKGYGPTYLREAAEQPRPGRWVFNWQHPFGVLNYLFTGLRLWAFPGLFYLLFGKIGLHFNVTRRWVYERFGTGAVDAVQRIPRIALMHHISSLPLETSRELARGLWKRLEPDQVILREDIEWIRTRSPGITIVISSASPQPALEVAREELGVDGIIFSEVEEHDGNLTAPDYLYRWFLLFRKPWRISPPSHTTQNASYAKRVHLQMQYPGFGEPGIETVGVTDTTHGEDHSWAEYFTKVVDLNSPDPFAPLVSESSPLVEIHSAQVLTREEKSRRDAGEAGYFDPRRKRAPGGEDRIYTHDELVAALNPIQASLDKMTAAFQRESQRIAAAREDTAKRMNELLQEIEEAVTEYNRSVGDARRKAFDRVRAMFHKRSTLQSQLARIERPLSRLTVELNSLLARARASLNRSR